MKRKILILTFALTTIFSLTACNKEEVIDNTPVMTVSKNYEILEDMNNLKINDGKFQYGDYIISINSGFDNVLNIPNVKITKEFGGDIVENTMIKPGEEVSVNVTINGDILTFYIQNNVTFAQYPSGCMIKGIYYYNTTDAKLNNKQYGMVYLPGGITLSEKVNNYSNYLKNELKLNKSVTSEKNTIEKYESTSYTLTIIYDKETKVINQIKYLAK